MRSKVTRGHFCVGSSKIDQYEVGELHALFSVYALDTTAFILKHSSGSIIHVNSRGLALQCSSIPFAMQGTVKIVGND